MRKGASRGALVAAYLPLAMVFFSSISGHGAQLCRFNLPNCAEALNGDTIVTPTMVTALSESVATCAPTCLLGAMCPQPTKPSIVFIIDQSASMHGLDPGTPAHDRWGARFRATQSIIDSLYRVAPDAEVGLVLFSDWLYLDHRTSDYYAKYLKTLPAAYDSNPDQSYCSFVSVNASDSAKKGFQILKDILASDTASNGTYRYVELTHKPLFYDQLTRGRNVNIAFTAAKELLKTAVNPKDRQFVIFITDGLPFGSRQAGLPAFDFEDGVGIPTTFTFYLTDSAAVPDDLTRMTGNILDNGYSLGNIKSNIWAVQGAYEGLLSSVWGAISSNIITYTPYPFQMTTNGITSTDVVGNNDGGWYFLFPGPFMLENGFTHFQTSTLYGKIINGNTGATKDTAVTSDCYVFRTDSIPPTQGIQVQCSDASVAPFVNRTPGYPQGDHLRRHYGGASTIRQYDMQGRRIVAAETNGIAGRVRAVRIVKMSDGAFRRIIAY